MIILIITLYVCIFIDSLKGYKASLISLSLCSIRIFYFYTFFFFFYTFIHRFLPTGTFLPLSPCTIYCIMIVLFSHTFPFPAVSYLLSLFSHTPCFPPSVAPLHLLLFSALALLLAFFLFPTLIHVRCPLLLVPFPLSPLAISLPSPFRNCSS